MPEQQVHLSSDRGVRQEIISHNFPMSSLNADMWELGRSTAKPEVFPEIAGTSSFEHQLLFDSRMWAFKVPRVILRAVDEHKMDIESRWWSGGCITCIEKLSW